jgi:hypothetical protein
VILRNGRRHFGTWLIFASHLNDDLNAALVGNSVGQQLPDRRCERIFADVGERCWDLRIGRPGGNRSGVFVLGCRPAKNQAARLCDGLVVALPVLQPVTDMSDRELITGTKPPSFDPLAIDSDAVGAPQIAHRDLAIILAHATVLTRNAQGIQARITRRVPTDNDHGTVQGYVWTFIEGHESSGHGELSSSGAAGGET